jgi:tRNA(Arg) A34 adenosine deaminase TadA
MNEQDLKHLRRAIALSVSAKEKGNHPFGALLVSEQGSVLMEAENTIATENDFTAHAEMNLVRMAARKYSAERLSRATLYSSAEPCVMCAGAIYWARVGRMVYALSQQTLCEMTGSRRTILSCRDVMSESEIIGPMMEEEARSAHEGFWKL